MQVRHGWIAVALLLAALHAAPGEAQGRSCDDGRGTLMTDLGFQPLTGSVSTDPRSGAPELEFDSEPRITGVRAGGPAAGKLREGDVVVALDGQPITTREGARRYSGIAPGELVRLTVRRGGQVQDVTLVATARCIPLPPAPPAPAPAHAPAAPEAPVPPNPASDEMLPEGRLGFAIDCQNCGEDESTGVFRFREPPVVTSVEPGSPAARAGLRPGDRLTHVDGVDLTSEMGWPRFRAIQPGEEVRLTYKRGDRTHCATLSALQLP